VSRVGVVGATIAAAGAIATPNAFAASIAIQTNDTGPVGVGGTLHSKATLGPNVAEGSTVDIDLMRGADCSGPVVKGTVWGDGKKANGDADPNDVIHHINSSQTFTMAIGNADGGTFSWRATLHDNGATSSSCSASVTVAPHPTSMTVTAANAATGGAIRATANLGARVKEPLGGPDPSITFTVYAPSDGSCSGAPIATSTRKVFTNQSAYASDNVTASAAGTYRWKITYSGDGNNGPATAGCGTAASDVADGAKPPSNGPTCQGVPATIVGSKKGETIIGTKEVDVIVARGGKDIVNGKGGNDIICGGSGKDILRGGGGNDVIFGNGGSDDVQGGKGNDELHGDAGGDRIVGGAGNDKLYGGKGNDGLDGGKGRDFGDGGAGTDVARSIERVPA
jgi:Ca2+-binding RTX toxin-like protein